MVFEIFRFCPVRVLFWLAATAHGQQISNWKCFYRVATFNLKFWQNLKISDHHVAKSLKFILGFEIFEKSYYELWTILFLVPNCGIFWQFSNHSVIFLVFTAFTSNMNFFDHSHSNPPSFCLAGFSPGGPSFEPSFEPSFPKLRSLWTKIWTKFWTHIKD